MTRVSKTMVRMSLTISIGVVINDPNSYDKWNDSPQDSAVSIKKIMCMTNLIAEKTLCKPRRWNRLHGQISIFIKVHLVIYFTVFIRHFKSSSQILISVRRDGLLHPKKLKNLNKMGQPYQKFYRFKIP